MLATALGPPTVINSGVIVAMDIELPDKLESVGAQMVREVAAKTFEMEGGGITTATVLAQGLVQQGLKWVAAGIDPMDLKRGIAAAVTAALAHLRENSQKKSRIDSRDRVLPLPHVVTMAKPSLRKPWRRTQRSLHQNLTPVEPPS